MKKRPTMDDVATEAGVSQATVSMVLNRAHEGRVSSETTERVLAAAQRLNYRTNVHAKVLREGKSRMLGLVGAEVATSPFAGAMILGAQQQAWEAGYVLLTVDTAGDPRLEQAAIEMMASYRVSGVLYAGMYHQVLEVPRALAGTPVVVVNSQDVSGRATSIFPDEVAGGREAASLLYDAGHRRIAMINIAERDSTLPAASGRLEGFLSVLDVRGVSAARELVRWGDGTYESGLAHTLELMSLPEPPTAIFCGNDRTALGTYRAALELGLSIPEDLSVVGFDDQEILSTIFRPRLATFRLPHEEMGRLGVDTLLGRATAGQRVAVHCSLTSHTDSVGPAKVLA